MTVYTIYHRTSQPADIIRQSGEAVFVKEGFSWAALFTQIFWLLFNRLWIASAVYVAGLALLPAIGGMLGGSAGAVIVLGGLMIALGFEANDIRGFFLSLHGYKTVGLVEGGSLGECERQFFSDIERAARLQPKAAAKQPKAITPVISASLSEQAETPIGLFPKPGV
jgi:Protein of unknown function (DUF2628)